MSRRKGLLDSIFRKENLYRWRESEDSGRSFGYHPGFDQSSSFGGPLYLRSTPTSSVSTQDSGGQVLSVERENDRSSPSSPVLRSSGSPTDLPHDPPVSSRDDRSEPRLPYKKLFDGPTRKPRHRVSVGVKEKSRLFTLEGRPSATTPSPVGPVSL